MKWIALYSQTGSEISALSLKIGRSPDIIFTNNKIPSPHVKGHYFTHKGLMHYLDNILDPKDYFITLHGYLRILPQHICEKYTIYNGHPGLITFYPELKGKDPQEKVTSDQQFVGSVVHKVTPIVDDGEIITFNYVENSEKTMKDIYNVCKKTSLNAWSEFFEK